MDAGFVTSKKQTTSEHKISNIGHCTGGRIEAQKAPRSSAEGARMEAPRGGMCGGGVPLLIGLNF